MLRTGRATPCWTARPTSTAAPCCSSSPPPTCTPATGRHSVSFVRPLIGHSTALWLADDWHQSKCVSPERWLWEWALKCSGAPVAPSPGRWGQSPGEISLILCAAQRFLFTPSSVSSNFLRHTKRRILIIRGVLTRCFSTDWVSYLFFSCVRLLSSPSDWSWCGVFPLISTSTTPTLAWRWFTIK